MRDLTQEEIEAINSVNGSKLLFTAMYTATASKLKKKGSNYTPPKKKRNK